MIDENDRELFIIASLYALVWFVVHVTIMPIGMLWYSVLIAVAYGGGHLYAGFKRGHIALSADSIAMPAAMLVFLPVVIYEVVVLQGAIEVAKGDYTIYDPLLQVIKSFMFAFVGGHAVLFSAAFLWDKITGGKDL
jgi:hypothetical protein